MYGQAANLMGLFGGAGMGGAGAGIAGTDPAEIMRLQREAQQQQRLANAMMQMGGRQANNWGDVILSLMAGYRANKAQGAADDNIAQAIERGLAYEQEQARAKAFQEQQAEQRKRDTDRAEWKWRQDYARDNAPPAPPRQPSDYERFQQDPEAYARFKAAGRAPQSEPQAPESVRKYEYLMSLPEEQRPMAARAMGIDLDGQGSSPSNDYERWKQDPEGFAQFQDAKRASTGDRPMPADAVRRIGLLDAAQQQLDKYIELTFDERGEGKTPDYNEVKNRWGTGREAFLRQAIQNMLYAKSGAAATDKEIERMLDNYSPSSFQRDGTNWAQIQSLKNDLDIQRRAITENRGGVSEPASPTGGVPPDEIMRRLREANPGTSDEELVAYAREQGYL